MRRSLVALALAGVLALAGCSGGSGGSASVDQGFGEQPMIEFPGGSAPADLTVERLHEGSGALVGQGDYIVANYIGQVWDAAEPFNDSWDVGYPIGFSLNMVIDGWKQGIPGSQVGDRLLVTIPSELGYPDGNENAGIQPGDTLVFVIDVLAAHPEGTWYGEAGATDTGELAGLPVTIDGALGAQPTITVKDGGTEPTANTANVVARGTGEVIAADSIVTVAYGVIGWDGTGAGNSWEAGSPESIPLGGGSVFDELVGVPVGSRVVLQVPATEGNPAMAAVVEVLGLVPANSTP